MRRGEGGGVVEIALCPAPCLQCLHKLRHLFIKSQTHLNCILRDILPLRSGSTARQQGKNQQKLLEEKQPNNDGGTTKVGLWFYSRSVPGLVSSVLWNIRSFRKHMDGFFEIFG